MPISKDKAERKYMAYLSEQGLYTLTGETEIETFCHDMAVAFLLQKARPSSHPHQLSQELGARL